MQAHQRQVLFGSAGYGAVALHHRRQQPRQALGALDLEASPGVGRKSVDVLCWDICRELTANFSGP